MSELVDRLLHTVNVKEFVKLFKEEVQEKYTSSTDFLTDIAAYLPQRLYERYYEDTVPHSLFGLTSACLIESLFAEDRRWHPFLQQSWFAATERKRTPLKLGEIKARTDGSQDERWREFERAANCSQFEEAYSWMKGFLSDENDRRFFRLNSLLYAAEDLFQGGHKFLYLLQMWRLAQCLNWAHSEKILAPALHFLVMAPKDCSLSETLKQGGKHQPLLSLLENEKELSEEAYAEVKKQILFGEDVDDSMQLLGSLAKSGVSSQSVNQALLLAATQAICNSDAGEWIWPMRAFHFIAQLEELHDASAQEKSLSLALAAALLQQASRRSREVNEDRELDEVARRLCPVDPFNVLRSVISHSDPYASATAAYAILGMDETEKQKLPGTLADLAVKNDAEMCYGHDLLFVHSISQSYPRIKLKDRNKLFVISAFFLGRVRKRYELFGAYGF